MAVALTWLKSELYFWVVSYSDSQVPLAKVGLVAIQHLARFYCTIKPDDIRNVIEMHRDYTMIDTYIRVRTSKWLVVPGERWMEWREVLLLVLSALHCWHQHIKCCIRQSQQTRELDCSSYSLSQVQCTTSVSSELCRVSPNDYACKSCFWELERESKSFQHCRWLNKKHGLLPSLDLPNRKHIRRPYHFPQLGHSLQCCHSFAVSICIVIGCPTFQTITYCYQTHFCGRC